MMNVKFIIISYGKAMGIQNAQLLTPSNLLFFFFLFDIQHDFTKVVHNFPIKAIQMQYSLSNDKSCSTSITEFLNNSIFNQTSKQAILIKCTT